MIEVRNSKIHGKGVFATENIPEGTIILRWDIDNLLTKKEYEKLTDKRYVTKFEGKYVLMQSPEKYVNHSHNPNTEVKDFSDIAIRNIEKGEEITTDYARDGSKLDFKCVCRYC